MAGREQLGFPKMGFPRPGPGRRHSSSDRLTLKYLQIRKCCRLWGNSVAVVSVGFLSPNVLLRQRLHDTRARRPKVFQEKPLLGPNICHKLLDCWGEKCIPLRVHWKDRAVWEITNWQPLSQINPTGM